VKRKGTPDDKRKKGGVIHGPEKGNEKKKGVNPSLQAHGKGIPSWATKKIALVREGGRGKGLSLEKK